MAQSPPATAPPTSPPAMEQIQEEGEAEGKKEGNGEVPLYAQVDKSKVSMEPRAAQFFSLKIPAALDVCICLAFSFMEEQCCLSLKGEF